MISYEECIRQGLIARAPYSEELVKGSIRKAEELLAEAQEDLRRGAFNSAAVMAYSAAFNAARGLLFRKGFREKSHACVARFIEAEYGEFPQDMIDLLDRYRGARHGVLYDVRRKAVRADAVEMVGFAESFIAEVKKTLAAPPRAGP